MKSIRNKVTVITGASSGIGRAAAYEFARKGARTVLASRRAEELENIRADLEKEGIRALIVPTDVTDPSQIKRLFSAAMEQFGRVDVLVNNAGVGLMGSFTETPVEDARKMFEVNFFAAAQVMKAALAAMEHQGSGVIINVASTAGVLPTAYVPYYGASKAALLSLSESANLEYMGKGIRVVAFCPHVTQTDFSAAAKCEGRYRNPVLFGHPISRGRRTERLVRILSLTSGGPFRPIPAEQVAEKLVRAALKSKPLVILGGFATRGLVAKVLFPPWFYAVAKACRKLMDVENPE